MHFLDDLTAHELTGTQGATSEQGKHTHWKRYSKTTNLHKQKPNSNVDHKKEQTKFISTSTRVVYGGHEQTKPHPMSKFLEAKQSKQKNSKVSFIEKKQQEIR